MERPDKLKQTLRELPDAPGCYLMRDRKGTVIYVGKAASLRKRVQSYFRDATLRRGSPKLRGLVKSVWDLETIVVRNEAEALLTEGRLIKEYRPYYNVSFKDDKRFLLLRVDSRVPLPRYTLCRIKRDDGARYFGPYASSAAARATLDFIEKQFGLRKCGPRVPDAETYKHCINDIVRYCSAPCVGNVNREQYMERVDAACAFLAGERPDLLKALREQMTEAAEAREFERAAALRDTLFRLESTVKQRVRIAPTPEMTREAGRRGVEALGRVLGLPSVPHCIEGYDISNISGTHAVASMVCSMDGLARRSRYRRFRIRTIEGSDDPGMMAEVIRRRFARLQEEGGACPDLVLLDGGPTQLKAARETLDGLGLRALPAVSLAKRFEEVYVRHDAKPVLLPRGSDGLQVLQRLRDEAHRFALTYHRRLRSRRIRESVLDEIPGIGTKRKQQLLAHFGSVYRLMKATEAELTAAPGVGPEMARAIVEALGA